MSRPARRRPRADAIALDPPRHKRQGWKSLYDPQAVMYHHPSGGVFGKHQPVPGAAGGAERHPGGRQELPDVAHSLRRGLVTVADVPAGLGRVIKIFHRFGIGARDIALRD